MYSVAGWIRSFAAALMSELFDVMEYLDLRVRVEFAQRPKRDQSQ
jgi:hypothetical protein